MTYKRKLIALHIRFAHSVDLSSQWGKLVSIHKLFKEEIKPTGKSINRLPDTVRQFIFVRILDLLL